MFKAWGKEIGPFDLEAGWNLRVWGFGVTFLFLGTDLAILQFMAGPFWASATYGR